MPHALVYYAGPDRHRSLEGPRAGLVRAVDVATRSILLLTPEPLDVVATVNILVRGFGPDLPIQLACQVGGGFNKRARAGLVCVTDFWIRRRTRPRQGGVRDGPYLSHAALEGVGAAAPRPRHNLRRR